MRLIEITLDVDTITRTGETFDANLVVGFTVINKGSSDCTLHYQGGPALLKISKGQSREFNGYSGFVWSKRMQIKFIGSEVGDVEVVKAVTSTSEV